MNFYIGSGFKNYKLVNQYSRILKEKGWKQTYDWTVNVQNDFVFEDLSGFAQLELQGIIDSDVVIILLPAGRGTHVELGIATALNKRVFLCANTKEELAAKNTVAFYELPNIIQFTGSADENITKILEFIEFSHEVSI